MGQASCNLGNSLNPFPVDHVCICFKSLVPWNTNMHSTAALMCSVLLYKTFLLLGDLWSVLIGWNRVNWNNMSGPDPCLFWSALAECSQMYSDVSCDSGLITDHS